MKSNSVNLRTTLRKYFARNWMRLERRLIGVFGLIAIGLGMIGFWQYDNMPLSVDALVTWFYQTLQLFIFQFSPEPQTPLPLALNIARFLAPAVAGYALFVGLARVFYEELNPIRMRLFVRDHVIVCGLGRKGFHLAKGFEAQGQAVVVIEQDPNSPYVRSCRELGISVRVGDATSQHVLRDALFSKAKMLIAVTGDDATNAKIALVAEKMASPKANAEQYKEASEPTKPKPPDAELIRLVKRKQPLRVIAHLTDPNLCLLLKPQEFVVREENSYRLSLFNIFDWGARAMLDESHLFADRQSGQAAPTILVIGVGEVGKSLVAHLAREWTNSEPDPAKKLRVILLDRKAKEKAARLNARPGSIASALNLEALEGDLRNIKIQDHLPQAENKQAPRLYVFICLGDDLLGLTTALELQTTLRKRSTTIILRLLEKHGLAELLERHPSGDPVLCAFPLYNKACQVDENRIFGTSLELFAARLHLYWEEQRHLENGQPIQKWQDAPDFHESSRLQAENLTKLLRQNGYDLGPRFDDSHPQIAFDAKEIDILAEQEHIRWFNERTRQGYKYGPVRDARLKTNPYLLEWQELPEKERNANRNLIQQIPEMFRAIDLEIYRVDTPLSQTDSVVLATVPTPHP